MDVKEFAKFVIDNMCRATIGNALNIVNKLDNPEYYNFEEFIVELQKYVASLLTTDFSKDKCYSILSLISTTVKKYRSNIKYNKTFILNDFIIDLWRIMNGH